MRRMLLLLTSVILHACAEGLPYGFYPVLPGDADRSADKIWSLVRGADRELRYDHRSMYDMRIGRMEDSVLHPMWFEFDEISRLPTWSTIAASLGAGLVARGIAGDLVRSKN